MVTNNVTMAPRIVTRIVLLLLFSLTFLPAARAEVAQVHIDYSVTASELVSRCKDAVQANRTDQAVELLAELLDKHTDELVEVEPGIYQQAARVARQLAAAWPDSAAKALQENRQVLARRQWQSLRHSTDVAELEGFARRYFCTPEGAAAAERAARLALEAGQTDVARLQIEDLLHYHPLRQQRGLAWSLLYTGALQLAGCAEAAKAAASQADQAGPPGVATHDELNWDGRSVPAEQIAQQMLALRPVAATSRPAGDVREKARLTVLWQTNLTGEATYGLGKKEPPAHWLPMPVVLAQPDLVLVQWDRRCSAFEPASGTRMWDYCPLSDKEAPRAGINGPTAPRRPATWQQRVYVVTEVPAPQHQPGPLKAPQGLSCLDAITGKPYWVRTAADMMSRSDPAVLDGTPVAQDGRVYLAGRVIRTGGYHEIHLLVVDALTGTLVKRVPLYGVARPEFTPNDRIKPVRLGLSGGVLYVASTAGAVAAIDTQSLQPIWMRSFKPNGPASEQADETREPNVPACWADEPLLLADRMILPVDTSLQVIDRWTGQSTATIPLDAPVQAIAGTQEPALQTAALAKGFLHIVDIAKGSIAHKLDAKARGIAGMTALPAGRFLVSLPDQLQVVQPGGANQALAIDYVPAGIPVVVGERILLGSNGYLTCLGDGEKPLTSLQAETQNGQRAGPAVQLVELSLRMGKPDVALDAMHRAVQQGATDPKRTSRQIVRQLYEISLAFGKHYSRKAGQENRRIARQLLAVAGRCAADARERILYLAAAADLRMAAGRPAEAVAYWQEILLDDVLRTAPLPEDLDSSSTTAGTWAQAKITEIIAAKGRRAYVTFDAEAARLLQAADKTSDRRKLDDLLARYPNSQSVPAAFLAVGRIAVTSGDAKGALEPLRKAAVQAESGSPVQTQAMARLSQAYERLASPQAAATWMNRLATIAPQTPVEANGRTSTAGKHAATLARRLPPTAAMPYRLDLPLRSGFQQVFEDTVRLVQESNAQNLPAGISLAWSIGFLRGVDARRGQPVWPRPVEMKTEPQLLAADKTRVVVHDRHQVATLEPATGQVLWTWSAKGPDIEAPEVDPESVPTIEAAAATREVVLVFTADKKTTCLERSTGQVRWQIAQGPVYAANLAVSDDLAVYRASQADRVVYVVLDVRTGRQVSLWQPSRNVPAEAAAVLPAGTVMLISPGAIEGYDAYSGTLFWQVAPQGRFRTAVRCLADTSLYIAEGERHITRIDTLTGKIVWRAQTRGRTGSPTQIVPGQGVIWAAADRSCHIIDEQTGKVLDPIPLPQTIPAHLEIREATPCQAGLLCLVTPHGKETSPSTAPMLALFTRENETTSATIAAKLDQATGPISSWQIKDGAVLVAAGNKLIGMGSR